MIGNLFPNDSPLIGRVGHVGQESLGHTSIVTTQRYTHTSKEYLIGVLRKHHPSLGMRGEAGIERG